MSRTRTLPVEPGLARLLADLPRDRLIALAASWGVNPPEQPGVVAMVYRRMTDAEAVSRAIADLTEPERLTFERLRNRQRAASQADLLRTLPFSTEALVETLNALEGHGLVWELTPSERGGTSSDVRWLVARDLAEVATPRAWRRRDQSPPIAAPGAPRQSPVSSPVPLSAPRGQPLTSGDAVRLIDLLVDDVLGEKRSSSWRHEPLFKYATHCALSLGVIAARGRQFEAGSRAEAWGKLAAADKVRALARLWRVDDIVSGGVPVEIRQCLAETLGSFTPLVWFDVDDVSRAVAVARGELATIPAGAVSDQSAGRSTTVARRDVERGLISLAWLGVAEVAMDSRERPVAVCVGDGGQRALA